MAATRVGTSDGGKRPLSVAVNPNGKAHVAYRGRDGKIHYRRWNGAEWEADEVVPSPGAQNYHPEIVASKKGAQVVFVAKLGTSSESYAIMHSQRKGKAWSEPTRISTEHYAQWGRIAVGEDGVAHVIYKTFGPNVNQVFYTRNDGGGWSKVQALGAGFYPDLALDGSGAPHVVWDNGNGIFYLRRGADGKWSHPQALASGKKQQTAGISADTTGALHVTWQARDKGGMNLTYARLSEASTAEVDQRVQGGALKLIFYPAVTTDCMNRVRLVYQGKLTNSGQEPWRVYQRVFDGTSWGDTERLDEPEMDAAAQVPEIACAGTAMVTGWWNSSAGEIYADVAALNCGGTLSGEARRKTKPRRRTTDDGRKTKAKGRTTKARKPTKRKTTTRARAKK